MLTNAANLKGLVIRATNGEIGTVDQFYFDDEAWAIRYLTLDTGGWLGGRRVLISPISVVHTDWQMKRLDVALTKKQVENSPNIDIHKPVSRQHEAVYLGYFAYPYYWGGTNMWGPALYPSGLPIPATVINEALADKKVLVAPSWIQRVSWMDSKVYVGLSREAIKEAPEFLESVPITRKYEDRLYLHYGQAPYWLREAEYEPSFSLSGVPVTDTGVR